MVGNCEVETCNLILSFKKKFACSLDLKCFDWKDLLDHFSSLETNDCERHQEKLLDSTIKNEIFLKYPIKKSYQLAFLKYLIEKTEECDIPFENAYELYVSLLSRQDDDEEGCFKHYFFGDKNIILKESRNFISGGTTGLCTWEAGKALANWSLFHPELFKGKEILELGCGSGLTGLAIINSALSPKKYIFTDCHPLVLDQLKVNLNTNLPGENWPRLKDNTVVDVVEFNWEEVTVRNLEAFKDTELIIGADIVYDTNLISSLSVVLEKLLSIKANCAVIACTVRNQDTIDTFVSTIKSKGLALELDTTIYPKVIEGNFSTPVNIYLINK